MFLKLLLRKSGKCLDFALPPVFGLAAMSSVNRPKLGRVSIDKYLPEVGIILSGDGHLYHAVSKFVDEPDRVAFAHTPLLLLKIEAEVDRLTMLALA